MLALGVGVYVSALTFFALSLPFLLCTRVFKASHYDYAFLVGHYTTFAHTLPWNIHWIFVVIRLHSLEFLEWVSCELLPNRRISVCYSSQLVWAISLAWLVDSIWRSVRVIKRLTGSVAWLLWGLSRFFSVRWKLIENAGVVGVLGNWWLRHVLDVWAWRVALGILVDMVIALSVLSSVSAADVSQQRRSFVLSLLTVERLDQSPTLSYLCCEVLQLDGCQSHKILNLLLTHNPVSKVNIQHAQRWPRDQLLEFRSKYHPSQCLKVAPDYLQIL